MTTRFESYGDWGALDDLGAPFLVFTIVLSLAAEGKLDAPGDLSIGGRIGEWTMVMLLKIISCSSTPSLPFHIRFRNSARGITMVTSWGISYENPRWRWIRRPSRFRKIRSTLREISTPSLYFILFNPRNFPIPWNKDLMPIRPHPFTPPCLQG